MVLDLFNFFFFAFKINETCCLSPLHSFIFIMISSLFVVIMGDPLQQIFSNLHHENWN